MRIKARNVWPKSWPFVLALGLMVLSGLPVVLDSEALLAGQNNSNRSSSRTNNRARRLAPKSNSNQTSNQQTTAQPQNSNGQSSTQGGQQTRTAYRVEAPRSNVKLEKIMTMGGKELPPETVEPIGSEITYTTFFTNEGNAVSHNLTIIDPIQDRTDFKIGSVINNLGTTGIKVTVGYSKDGGETCDYTPVSGGGGAPEGFDRQVNAVCWSFSGDLGFTPPHNSGDINYVGRRR